VHFSLQRPDLPGQHRLGDVQLGGGPPEMQMPGYRHEVAQLAQVDVDATRVLQTAEQVLDETSPPGAPLMS
jgi:hypothetical protein